MNRLKELRKEKKLTQKELADIIGTTKLTVSNWENGKHSMNSDKAQVLADYFGVSVGYLLGFSSEKLKFAKPIDGETQKEKRLRVGLDKLILNSGITEVSSFVKKMVDQVEVENDLKNLSISEIVKIKEDESYTKQKTKEFQAQLKNTAMALSYLDKSESELLSLFYVLDNQDKNVVLRIVRGLVSSSQKNDVP